ncbi:MAG: leucine-rich repeat protein [Prevotella sp.]|nr:leucine-rich repeat protein [Prevotella sp.]
MNKLIWSILFYCCTLRVCGQENTFTYVVIDSVQQVEMCLDPDILGNTACVGISKYHHPAIPVTTKGRIVIPSKITNENGKTSVVTAISRAGLQGCKELTEVVLPDSCLGFGDQAMQGCEKLESITFPATMRVLYAKAMSGCTSLRRVTVLAKEPPECAENVFDEQTYQTATLVVPAGSEDAYRRAPAWRKFKFRMVNFEF